MARTKRKPTDPQDIASIAERRAERRELESRGIEVNVDPRTEEITARYRPDCFTVLLRGRPDEQAAVQWLEELIRTASGENGSDRRPDYIRGSAEGAPGQNVSQAMIDAELYLVTATEALPPQCAKMLFDLLKPDAALRDRWRPVVERYLGVTNPASQADAVRIVCVQLRWVQVSIDRLVRERRDRRMVA
jgi:hypothetical protein